METRFNENLRKKERASENYQAQARACRVQNGNKPTEGECRFLQMAADLEYEMSQITIGAEQSRHEAEKNRLDSEIMWIRQQLSGGSAVKKASAGEKSSDRNEKNEEDPLERTVRTWYKESPKHSFDDVSGMSELKKRLQECLTDAKSQELMDYLQIPYLNSYFFVGPPGCGKTYIIEAFAHELLEKDYKYLSLQGSDIISRYVGDAEKIVTRLFTEAKNCAPCIIFIDEVDSVCKNRSLPNLPEYAANITTSFLTGFNEIHSADSEVIFIGATNYPQRVDSAMLDRVEVIEVTLPDTEARAAALKKQFNGIIMLEDGFDYDMMADDTDQFNYRDIERICVRIKKDIFKEVMNIFQSQLTSIKALRQGDYRLTEKKWKETIARFKPSPKQDILDAIADWKKRNLEDSDTDDDIEPVEVME